jgi:integrase
MKMKTTRKLKQPITTKEHKLLISNIIGNEDMRLATKDNLLKTFTFLYYSGVRLNEIQELTYGDIRKLLDDEELIINLSKTATQRKLFLSKDFKKDIEKYFDVHNEKYNNDTRLILKNGSAILNKGIHITTFIQLVNKTIQNVLNENFSSHSYRRGLITEMAQKKINPKIISTFIGHSSTQTTMMYISPTDNDLRGALVR